METASLVKTFIAAEEVEAKVEVVHVGVKVVFPVSRLVRVLGRLMRTVHLQLRKAVVSCRVTTPEEWPKASGVDLSGNGCQIIFNPESKIGDRPSVFRRRSQAFSGGGRAPKQGQSATLVSVGDGDTIRVRTSSGRNQTIRLACIDAPERAQGAPGQVAREALAAMVQSGPLQIKPQTTVRYGRSVAEVFVGGRNVNLELVRGGFAFAYRKYLAQCDQAAYLGAEAWAQQYGQGVWRYGTERPWDYRQRRK
jgi:endonuclease YncB( thermonuclease family)